MASRGAESGRCPAGTHDAPPTALAFHGAGGGAWEWAHWARAWQARGGHFRAADFSRAAARPDIGWSDLLASLRRAHARHSGAVLLGASFGGCVACALAADLDARALVLLNPLLPGGDHSAALPYQAPMRAWGLRASATGTRRAIPELSDTESAVCFRRWSDFNAGLIEGVRAMPMPARSACPVLILSSRDDVDIDRTSLVRLATAWSATLVELPGSHVSPLLGHAWSRAFDVVEAWLKALDRPGA